MASQKRFDALIIGGGLSGLAVATALAKSNQSIALVEASDSLGGTCRGIQTPTGVMEHSLKTLPDVPATREAIDFIEELIGKSILTASYDAAPVTFQKGHFQPFVGFGAHAPDSHSALEYYLVPQRLRVSLPPSQWVAALSEKYIGTRFMKTRVTHLDVVDKRVKHVILNGQEAVEATHVIYCAPLKDLPTLFAKDVLNHKAQQKIASSELWTSLGLDLTLDQPIGEPEKTYVLYGGVEETKACIGQFLSPITDSEGRTHQQSHWLTFLPEELTSNDEATAGALKEIKRQMKRAFGEAILSAITYERILVTARSHGEISLKLEAGQNFSDLKNLSLCSPLLRPPHHIVGTLIQAREVLKGLGVTPAKAVPQSDSERPSEPEAQF